MSLGESEGGLVPDCCCEKEDACLQEMRRLVEDYHDNSKCVPVSWQPPAPGG